MLTYYNIHRNVPYQTQTYTNNVSLMVSTFIIKHGERVARNKRWWRHYETIELYDVQGNKESLTYAYATIYSRPTRVSILIQSKQQ